MVEIEEYLSQVNRPANQSYERLDARDLPPPQPLKNTLERLEELDPSVDLVQLNDRKPQHLYPQLEDRGYHYETVDEDEVVVTIIWEE